MILGCINRKIESKTGKVIPKFPKGGKLTEGRNPQLLENVPKSRAHTVSGNTYGILSWLWELALKRNDTGVKLSKKWKIWVDSG